MPNIKMFSQIALTWMATSCVAVATPTISLTQPLDQQMQEAIAADNAGKVAYMLRELGYDPNFYLPNGDTPLVFAIRMDATTSVNKVLLKSYKINVKVPTIRGETPLMLAAIKGDKALAQKLLDMGAPINADYGWTALHYSASTGKHEMTQFLIDKGAEVNARTERGVTPLYMAARIVAAPTVEVLLRAGADKTLCNDQGISPEAIARKRGNSVLADKLHIDQCAPWPPVATNTTNADNTGSEDTETSPAKNAATEHNGVSDNALTQTREKTAEVRATDSENTESKASQQAVEPMATQEVKPEPAAPLFGPLGHQEAFNPAARSGGTK